jgi:SAM-dependent methyltransferase
MTNNALPTGIGVYNIAAHDLQRLLNRLGYSLHRIGTIASLQAKERAFHEYVKNIHQRVADLEQRLDAHNKATESQVLQHSESDAPDYFLTDAPDIRNTFDLFKDEWSSNIPEYGYGPVGLFNDHRIHWFMDQCGGVAGKKVLELGPLEGAHTKMISDAGGDVTAIEANTRAFMKCLVIQNAFKFKANFLLGDFRPYLSTCADQYDLLMACGVLYHMTDPVKLLSDAGRVSRAIGVWTHYYDAEVIQGSDVLRPKFDAVPKRIRLGTRLIEMHEQNYLEATKWKGFCGGTAPTSYWFTRQSLLDVLEELKFDVTIHEDEKHHPNGPCITLFARTR